MKCQKGVGVNFSLSHTFLWVLTLLMHISVIFLFFLTFYFIYIYIYIFKWLSLCLGVKLVLTAKPVFAYNRNYVANFRLKDIAVLLDTVRTVGVGYEEVPCILVSSEGIYTARVDNVYSISLKILRKCIHTDTLQLEYSRV